MLKPWFWPTSRALLVGLVLCRGLMLLCVLPPFEGWDEYQHVGYVEHVRQTGRAAVMDETCVPPRLLAEATKFPQPAFVANDQLRRLGGIDYPTFWERNDTDRPSGTSEYKGGTVPLYQAQHSPLYYRLAAPLFAALGGVDDLRSSVGGLRVANLLLTAAAVWVVLGAVRRAVRRERDAVLIGLTLAAHPMFLLNGTRVANDALGVFLASLVVAFGLALEPRRLGARSLGVGLLIGLAGLAKATNLGLVPFAGFCWLAMVVRAKVPAGRAVLSGAAMATGCLAVMQAELRFNLAHYGGLTSMQEAIVNHREGRTVADLLRTAATIDWPVIVRRLWVRDLFYTGGWSHLRSHIDAVRAYQRAATFGLFGWAWWFLVRWRRRRDDGGVFTSGWVPSACLVLVLSFSAALGYHVVQSTLAWGAPSTNPWYACPALPWFLALAAGGGLAWPLGSRLRPAVPLALAGAGLAGEFIGVWGQMVPAYTGGASGREALRRLAWLQPGLLGTATLVAACAGEVVMIAALIMAWRSAGREDDAPATSPLLRGTHVSAGEGGRPIAQRLQ